MKLNPALFLLIFILSISTSLSQFRLEGWEVHTSMYNIQTADVSPDGKIWAAGLGGMFSFDPATQKFELFSNINALSSLKVNKVKSDINGSIYIGGIEGHFDFNDGEWHNIFDIISAGFANSTINDFLFANDKVYIAGGFGLTVFDPDELVFIEDIVRYGEFQKNSQTNAIEFYNNFIWVATESGVAMAQIAPSIADRNQWTNFTREDGLFENNVTDIKIVNGTIYVATGRTIQQFKEGKFETVSSMDEPVLNLAAFGNEIYACSENLVWSSSTGILPITHPSKINSITANPFNGHLIICYSESGIGIWDYEKLQVVIPNTPVTNGISDIKASPTGDIWFAGDVEFGKGFMRLKDGNWHNYTTKDYPEIRSNTYHRVSVDNTGVAYLSGWGTGMMKFVVADGQPQIEIFNHENSPFLGIGDGSFVVAGETGITFDGTLWVTNYGLNTSGPVLLAYKEGQFYSFDNCRSQTSRYYRPLAIDFFGTKWMGSDSDTGILFFNENNTLDNKSDDECGILRTFDYENLLDDSQNALAVDNLGILWIGTDQGLSALVNPSAVLSNNTPIFREIRPLRGQKVNDIVVDALNNKWIATPSGVWVLNEDGTELLTENPVNSGNSPMPENDVLSIELDPETGTAYFGTTGGIVSVKSLSIRPRESYDISCYPQPFYPEKDLELVIDGLGPDSDIRILTINGELVRKIKAKGRKTIWDGRHENGDMVNSGVYMVAAGSGTSETSGVAKIAVIRGN